MFPSSTTQPQQQQQSGVSSQNTTPSSGGGPGTQQQQQQSQPQQQQHAPTVYRGIVKQALSGDAVIVRGQPRGGPPPEKQINLSNIVAPKLARRPVESGQETKDEPFAWEAREFLRKKLVGQEIAYTVEYKAPASGREYGSIYLGKDTTGENVAESLVSEGFVEVRQGVKVGDEYYQRLNDLQNSAKSAGKGKWASEGLAEHVRDIKWSVENPRNFVDSQRKKPIQAVVEHVRDGSTIRAFLLPSFHYVTVMITGIKCPGFKLNDDGKLQEKGAEPFADEAKYFVETRLLQRDVEIILESASNQNFIGTVLHPKGNIAEALLSEGFAKCVDWSLAVVSEGPEKYRAAERQAKEKRLRLWKSYDPTANAGSSILNGKDAASRTYQAKVVEIVMGDAVVVKKNDKEFQKIWLSSIRPPRSEDSAGASSGKENQISGRQFRPLYDIPFMFEAREFLRKKLIGKKVSVTIDYVQPAFEKFPEKTCCTVMIGGQNVAEALVAKGFATVVRYAQGNENRSSQYDQLLAAEAKAEKSRKGVHSLKSSADMATAGATTGPKEIPIVRVQDLQGDYTKSKQFFPFLQRAGRSEGIVEFVASGSRFRIYVPKETCLLTFLLSGISCPRAPRTGPAGDFTEGEPFGDEALQFIKELCLQHEVEFEVETMDKAGNFVGYAFIDNKNLSELLLEQGLAKLHSTAERSKWYSSLKSAEERARRAELKIWTLPENKQKIIVDDEDEESTETSNFRPSQATDGTNRGQQRFMDASGSPLIGSNTFGAPVERPIDYKNVFVTEVLPDLRFYVQLVDQGQKLEHMMSELRAELTADPPLPGSYNPHKGDLCAAKFSADGQWYRAKIENVKSRDHCEILFIDFGNREVTNANMLANLPSSYHHTTAGAKEYRLAFVQLPEDPADQEAAVSFFAQQVLAGGQQLLLNVEYKANGLDHATLFRASDKRDLGKLLISNGYALVENKRERRLQSIMAEYREAQDSAKKSRLNLWQYGDFTGDEL